MRKSLTVAIAFCIAAIFGSSNAQAALFGMPRALGAQVERLRLDSPTLPPIAHTRFCLQYPQDCVVHRMAFRGGGLNMTAERMKELVAVNIETNRAIRFESNPGGVLTEEWLISPNTGDCNDYAVTKRHQLLSKGWPSWSLLLAEVVTTWGEHHLVLIVRTKQGDLVADSLNSNIRHWSKASYSWVRIQSPQNPMFWSRLVQSNA